MLSSFETKITQIIDKKFQEMEEHIILKLKLEKTRNVNSLKTETENVKNTNPIKNNIVSIIKDLITALEGNILPFSSNITKLLTHHRPSVKFKNEDIWDDELNHLIQSMKNVLSSY